MSETSSDSYKTIKVDGTGLFKEKGSKFISYAYMVENETMVKEYLDMLRKKHFDARHHCYAWVLGTETTNYRANDDGEPSGSAGKPILNQIYSASLTNVLVVVVRYFGGIKLGVSGLINAYKIASREAISNAEIIELTINHVFYLHFDWPLMNEVMRVLKEEQIQPEQIAEENGCIMKLSVRKSSAVNLLNRLSILYGVTIRAE